MYYSRYKQPEKRLYKATFEGIDKDHRTFRAWNDFQAMKRADKMAAENGWGNVRHIYEVTERGVIVRGVTSFKTRRA
jgi:hypothetical protein